MFNRYSLTTPQVLAKRFLAKATQPLSVQPRYNVVGGQRMPVIVWSGGAYRIEPMRWGLVPAWSKDSGHAFLTAYAETIAERSSSKLAFRSQRCLVPATSFFASRLDRDQRRHYLFRLAREEVLAFAGIFDRWQGPDGTELRSFAIVTCPANELVSPMSEVMPVMLRRGDETSWLDPQLADPTFLTSLLRPFPAAQMRAHRVSSAVHSPDNDSPEVIQPIGDRQADRYVPDLA